MIRFSSATGRYFYAREGGKVMTMAKTAADMRDQAVAYMKSRKRMNGYTNGDDRVYFFGKPSNVPGNTTQKGFSDCSRAVQKSILAAAGIGIGHNTHYQILNQANGRVVDQTNGFYPDESKLLPGDCLYFKGNKYHVEDVGHVEMYTGPNECWGHGSGTGPNPHNLRDYCRSRATPDKRYYKAIRWIPDDGKLPELTVGASGYYVTMMQLLLLGHGYPLPEWGADGDFGTETHGAITAYQKDKGLAVTGKCDAETWASLTGSQPIEPEEPEEVDPHPQPAIDKKHMVAFGAGVGVKGGVVGVKWVQWELVDAGFSCGVSGIDGEFGKRTKDAVIAFQRKAFPGDPFEWDGIVGPNTRDKLVTVKGAKWLEVGE